MDRIVSIISKLSQNLGEMEELAREQLNMKELTTAQMHYLEIINEMSNPNITELKTGEVPICI